MKFAGTVVLYNPEKEVIENMQTYLPIVDVLYVMDNSTREYDFVEDIKKIDKVKYISLNGNKGIAKALKVATETAIVDGYDFLLSMDQDSKFPTGDFKFVEEYLNNNDISKLGILAINYSGSLIKSEGDKRSFIEVNDAISSGTFLNLKNYRLIEGYNEKLFIDYVDYDVSYQFREKNLKIILLPNIILKHKLGNSKKVKFLFYKKEIIIHNPLRYYYMYRNYTYLLNTKSEKYVNFLLERRADFSLKFKIRRFLIEKPHFKILKMIRRGIRDGKRGILGPYQEKRGK